MGAKAKPFGAVAETVQLAVTSLAMMNPTARGGLVRLARMRCCNSSTGCWRR